MHINNKVAYPNTSSYNFYLNPNNSNDYGMNIRNLNKYVYFICFL